MSKLFFFIFAFFLNLNISFAEKKESDDLAHLKEIEELDQETLDQAEILFFSGLSSYRSNQFAYAAEKFQKAFLLTKHRDLLYNIARSREKMGDSKGAIEWYRVYLGTKPSDVTAIIHRIRLLGGDPTPLESIPQKNQDRPKEIINEQSSGPVPWLLASFSLISAASGIYFGMDALNNASDARKSKFYSEAKSFKDNSELSATYADISFILSSISLAGAVYLFLDSDSKQNEGSVNVIPGKNSAYLQYYFSF